MLDVEKLPSSCSSEIYAALSSIYALERCLLKGGCLSSYQTRVLLTKNTVSVLITEDEASNPQREYPEWVLNILAFHSCTICIILIWFWSCFFEQLVQLLVHVETIDSSYKSFKSKSTFRLHGITTLESVKFEAQPCTRARSRFGSIIQHTFQFDPNHTENRTALT